MLKKAAYQVDKYVAEIFRRKKLTVPKVVDDSTFLRRSFLVAAGRIPTLEEAASFLESKIPPSGRCWSIICSKAMAIAATGTRF